MRLRILGLMVVLMLIGVIAAVTSAQEDVTYRGPCASIDNDSFRIDDSGLNTTCTIINDDGEWQTGSEELGYYFINANGVQQVVDIYLFETWGAVNVQYFVRPVRVCLEGLGEFVFLSAAESPRKVKYPDALTENGYTCAEIPNSGTAILANGNAAPPPPSPTPDPATVPDTLQNCQVTTIVLARLREDPEANGISNVIASIPEGVTFTATERLDDWFRVIFEDRQAWVNDIAIEATGTCN